MMVLKLSVICIVILLSTSTTLSDKYVDVRIVNGFTATPGQFPHQALLLVTEILFKALCGGSLLSNEWVITAAHCTHAATEFKVTLGAQSYDDISEPGRITDRTKIKFVHPSYNILKGHINDLSLVKLSKKIEFTDRIQPVLLPKSDDSFVGSAVIASGWGLTRTNGEHASQLQWAPMRIIDNGVCGKPYQQIIPHTIICAQGNLKESACQGDSGGPLVLQSDNKTLIGVVSFGHRGGCHLGIPHGFTRVAYYKQWIKGVTGIDST